MKIKRKTYIVKVYTYSETIAKPLQLILVERDDVEILMEILSRSPSVIGTAAFDDSGKWIGNRDGAA